MTPTRILTLAVTAGALALTLTACTAAPSPAPTAAAPTAAAATAAPVVDAQPAATATATEAAPALAVGASVTDPAVLAACDGSNAPLGIISYGEGAGKCPLSDGLQVYVAADGSGTVIDRKQPLPANVLADVTSRQHAGVTADHSTDGATWGVQATAAIKAINIATGKQTVVIERVKGRVNCAGSVTTIYTQMMSSGYLGGGNTCGAFATADEAYADAVSQISTRSDASTWLVLPFAE